jgi:hypothetical protein
MPETAGSSRGKTTTDDDGDTRAAAIPEINLDDLLGARATPTVRVREYTRPPHDERSTWKSTKSKVDKRKKALAKATVRAGSLKSVFKKQATDSELPFSPLMIALGGLGALVGLVVLTRK